jgi:tetratricopeptide (TPR) repeat protein
VYAAKGDHDKCLEWCNLGLEKNPINEELLMYKSEAYYSLKKHTDSRKVLFQLLQIDPKNTSAIRLIASTFQRQHTWDSSIVYFNRAIEINPLDYISYFDRGIDKSEKKDFEGAKTDIEKAMKLDTASKFIGYNNLGFFLKLEQKDYIGAIECFNKSIAYAPKFAYAYSNRGYAKLCLGDIDGAVKDVKRSLELDNTNSYAHKNMGLVNLKRGKNKEACENFKTAIVKGYTETYDDEVEKLLTENCK